MSMYRVKRNIYKVNHPFWVDSLLYNIQPLRYDPQPNREDCVKNLMAILDAIKKHSYIWHQGYYKIDKICNLVVCNDYIKLLSKRGVLILSFVIIECDDDGFKVK